MKNFACSCCSQLVFFENVRCEKCGHRLGYVAASETVSALEDEGGAWRALSDGKLYRFCANAQHDACNWLIETDDEAVYCRACRHNKIIPNLSEPENILRWRHLELAKHRLFYSLLRFGLPLPNRIDDPEHGLVFAFLADDEAPDGPKILTGHADGLITVALKEADAATREQQRANFGETYRTLLGHFRHEIGHYFWDVLVRDGGRLESFRAIFGDERADYEEALKAHYANPNQSAWQNDFVSFYASSHPWEDFAESWAHYLHIVDTLDTAAACGVRLRPEGADPMLSAKINFDAYKTEDLATLLEAWLPLTMAVNSLNRSMGQPDLYPFILSAKVIEKIGFVHRLIKEGAEGTAWTEGEPSGAQPAAGKTAAQRANAA